MSEENKQRLKEYPKNYRKGKATDEHYTQNKEAIKEKSRERYKNLSREEKDKTNGRRRKRYPELDSYQKEALKNKNFFVLCIV